MEQSSSYIAAAMRSNCKIARETARLANALSPSIAGAGACASQAEAAAILEMSDQLRR
jgi:hypothetical protein